jgi:hypothetical protein
MPLRGERGRPDEHGRAGGGLGIAALQVGIHLGHEFFQAVAAVVAGDVGTPSSPPLPIGPPPTTLQADRES